jgi:hypothetical protein
MSSGNAAETEENDFVFALHRDFNDRTGGKTSATVESTVGDYHLDVNLCQQLLREFDWADAAERRCRALRRGQADCKRAVATEVLRRQWVRILVSKMLARINRSSQRPVPHHLVIELLTGWILHERNDPGHDDAVFALRRNSGELITPETMYQESYPLDLLRSFVLQSDLGAEVVVTATQERAVLSRLINCWRGEFKSATSVQEHELADVVLVNADHHILDVLIPSPDLAPRGSSTAVFVRMLKWCGEKSSAATATTDITTIVKLIRQEFFRSSLGLSLASQGTVSFSHGISELCGERVDTVEIVFGSLRCPMLLRAWNKMKALYEASNPHDQNCEEFPSRLLVVLLRYASLSGATVQNVDQTAGFHAAVPPKIYAKLRCNLNTVLEGFASPMNSTSTMFCSLFPDCDSYFGSLGSFFELSVSRDFPNGVSMTCNPPYSIIVMTRVSDQLTRMYSDANALRVPLQVFVVVCNWSSVGGESGRKIIDSLHQHISCVRHASLLPERAPFQDGHAFVLNRPFFTLGTNTEVFLFQNDVAHALWPSHREHGFDTVISEWQSLGVREGSNKRQRE